MTPKLTRLYWFFGWLYDFTKVVTVIFVVLLLLHFFVATLNQVQGNSMLPTYHNKELLVIDRLSYRFNAPKRGDVISFYFPGTENKKFVKRIIGLPLERITIENGAILINDRPLPEKYLLAGIVTSPSLSYTLAQDEYYVVGDARSDSLDSRTWGGLPKSYIIGRVMKKVWPLSAGLSKRLHLPLAQ